MCLTKGIALVMSLCLAIGIAACQHPPKGGQPAPEISKGRDAEPGWTVGWSRLREQMDAVDVLSLLDEPQHVKVNKVNTTWYYSDRGAEGPYVVFDTRRMRVERWRAPKSR